MAISPFTTWCPAATSIETLVDGEGHRWAIEDSFETAKNEFGLDHNESRSWHGWHRHVSMAMLAFARRSDIALIRHSPKKRNIDHRQKPKQSHGLTDPLVYPGNPPHCHQTRAKAYSTRTHHRMVFLASSSPSCRSTRTSQKKATVC
jgi:hypothetical protein